MRLLCGWLLLLVIGRLWDPQISPAPFRGRLRDDVPCRGLNLSLPKTGDLWFRTSEAGGRRSRAEGPTHLKEMPYWATWSKPDFHTRVTSQALVAWSRHDRKADTAFPPTEATFISSKSSMVMKRAIADACAPRGPR